MCRRCEIARGDRTKTIQHALFRTFERAAIREPLKMALDRIRPTFGDLCALPVQPATVVD